MKRIYVPKGETVTYDNLNTGNAVVKGILIVKGLFTATHIQGKGKVQAEEIQCDTIEVDTVQADIVTARKVVGKKLFIRDCRATDAVMAVDFIESIRVMTKKLYMSLSSISECEADEIIILKQKNRGLFRMLIASKLRCILLSRSCKEKDSKNTAVKNEALVDTEYENKSGNKDTQIQQQTSNSELVTAILDYLEHGGYLAEDVHIPSAETVIKEVA